MSSLSFKILEFMSVVILFVCGAIYADTTPTEAPSDSQILRIVETANNAEIKASKLETNSANPDVKQLAQNMVKAHTKSNVEVAQMARGLSLKEEDSQSSDEIKKDSANQYADLKTMQGPALDKAYVDAIVTAHQNVLKSLDDTLIPSAKNTNLVSLLKKTRETVEIHLEHAKQIQTALNK